MSIGASTVSLGIHQSDLILRSAILEGIADLRKKPHLLDYCFAGLPKDDLTSAEYGEKVVKRAKDWFMATKIAVFMNTRKEPPVFPSVSIKLASSAGDEATIGDVDSEVQEDSDILWPDLVPRFDPVSYNRTTGVLVVPSSVSDALLLAEGQVVLDKVGNEYPILQVDDAFTVRIQTGISVDLHGLVIRGQRPAYVVTLESEEFAETYMIGCFAAGDPEHLMFLHSIVCFVLLVYRESLLERRNFERSRFTSTDLVQNTAFENELVYSRFVSLSGSVRNYWPKSIEPKITGTQTQPRAIGGGLMFSSVEDEAWVGDQDPLLAAPPK